METGRSRRSTEEVNLSETVAKTLLSRRRVRRSTVSEDEEYGDYADYDAEQDYPASNTSYEDSPEVTIPLLLLA